MVLPLLALLGTAQARDPSCPDLTVAQLEGLIEQVDLAYLNLDMRQANALLAAAEPRVPCILEIVPTSVVAAFALRRSYSLALELDPSEAKRWARLAKALEPSLPWPAYIPSDHEIRDLIADEEPAQKIPVRAKGLAVPPGGGVFLDGRFLDKPEAETAIPHLLQVGDVNGELVVATWQDGTAFPEEILGPPTASPPVLPEWYGKPLGTVKTRKPPRPWTESRERRLETSLGFLVAGGTLYGSALLARSAYEQRPTDGLFYAVDGATVLSGAAGGTALVFLGAALFGR
jgi:hypothetical protein